MIWVAVYDRRRREGLGRLCAPGVGLREGAEEPLRRLQRGRAADLAAVLARRVKTGHIALIPVTEELLWGALEVGTPPYAPLKPPRYVRSWFRPTPWDVLELEWCPRYLWLSKRHGVPVTPSMAKGKAEEGVLRRRLAAALGGEPKPVYIDAGWAHGVVDMLARGRSAVPVEIKTGVPRREHKWQIYAEAYLVKASLMSVSQAVLAYGERIIRPAATAAELKAAKALLHKAAEVVEGPPPPPIKTAKCLYCQYRPICTST